MLTKMKMRRQTMMSGSMYHRHFAYDADGKLLSADKSYFNPFLGFRKQTLSMQNMADQSSAVPDFALKRTTNSKRMNVLSSVAHKIAPDGSTVERFADNYSVVRERDLSSRIGTTSSVSKDHILSVRQIKNAKGEVIQEKECKTIPHTDKNL